VLRLARHLQDSVRAMIDAAGVAIDTETRA